MSTEAALRCGLIGTGYWARTCHAPALATADGVSFTAVWGRDPAAARALAAAHGAITYADLDAFLDSVDAVVFCVPPDVQSELALRAAAAGKHLLLEKPIALTPQAADDLVREVEAAQVASVAFFTARFQPEVRDWLAGIHATGGWLGGHAVWLSSALQPGNPFRTPWRQRKGALWDLGPHLVSLLWASLGPVVSVTARAGLADVTSLIFGHASGATSTATVTLSAPEDAETEQLTLWGASGQSRAPAEDAPVAALRLALGELAANVAAGRVDHPCDAAFGRDVVQLLAEAERQIGTETGGPT